MVEVLEFPEQTHAGTGKLPTAFLQKKLGIIQKPMFKFLLPPLSEDEYKGLEANILKEGCHEPLILWDNVIIDGHNRYEICCKHNVIFKTKDVTFKNDLDAKIWIVEHQLKHRRNLSDKDKIKGVLLLEGFYKEKANENQGTRTDLCSVLNTSLKETPKESQDRRNKNRVNSQIADLADVSTAKVFRYKEILEHGTPEEIEAVDSGEAKICPTYDKIVARERKEQSAISFPKEKYRVVYADLYERDDSSVGWSLKGNTTEIRNIPMKGFLEDSAVCFLWTPPNYLTETLIIMKKWGFEYASSFVLESEPVRDCYNSLDHMFVLVGEKNGCIPDVKQKFSSVLNKEKYSTDRYMKFKHLIEDLYQEGNKIEFFPEKGTLGWDKYQEQEDII